MSNQNSPIHLFEETWPKEQHVKLQQVPHFYNFGNLICTFAINEKNCMLVGVFHRQLLVPRGINRHIYPFSPISILNKMNALTKPLKFEVCRSSLFLTYYMHDRKRHRLGLHEAQNWDCPDKLRWFSHISPACGLFTPAQIAGEIALFTVHVYCTHRYPALHIHFTIPLACADSHFFCWVEVTRNKLLFLSLRSITYMHTDSTKQFITPGMGEKSEL